MLPRRGQCIASVFFVGIQRLHPRGLQLLDALLHVDHAVECERAILRHDVNLLVAGFVDQEDWGQPGAGQGQGTHQRRLEWQL